MNTGILFVLPVFLAGAPHPGAPECLSYAPTVVTLQGTLGMVGGAGDGARGGGDRELVLLLDKPICVRTHPSTPPDWEDRDGIRLVHLVMPSAAMAKSTRRLLRERIVVRGQLVGGEPGMHRTEVGMEVQAVRQE